MRAYGDDALSDPAAHVVEAMNDSAQIGTPGVELGLCPGEVLQLDRLVGRMNECKQPVLLAYPDGTQHLVRDEGQLTRNLLLVHIQNRQSRREDVLRHLVGAQSPQVMKTGTLGSGALASDSAFKPSLPPFSCRQSEADCLTSTEKFAPFG